MKGAFIMTFTKADLVESIYNELDIPKNQSIELVEYLLDLIKETLENGEDVLVSGFGKFSVKEKKERRGRNPQTGEDMILDSRRVVTFKCSPVLKEKMNNEQ